MKNGERIQDTETFRILLDCLVRYLRDHPQGMLQESGNRSQQGSDKEFCDPVEGNHGDLHSKQK